MKKNYRGFGLIEVLVTLLVLSTSLLALATLQARSLQYNHGSYLRSQANIYAYDILDRIRLNKANISAYNVAPAIFTPGTPVTTPVAARDIDQWRTLITASFANGKGGIACDAATGICTVTIVWDEVNSTGTVEDQQTSFAYTTKI